MNSTLTAAPRVHTAMSWPLVMAFIRLPLALAGSGMAILAYQWSGQPVGIAAGLVWSTFTITTVNLICIGLLSWRARVEGFHLKEMIGFRRNRLLSDLGMGLLWSFLLYFLLLAGASGMIVSVYGTGQLADIGTLLFGDANFSFRMPGWLSWVNILVSAVAFPLLNPIVEELQYRGYAQPRLGAASGSIRKGIIITAAGFGLQHVVFTATLPAALAFAVGFFMWGLGAGVIAHRQGRLFPLIVAHFISNLPFGIIPLIFTLQGG